MKLFGGKRSSHHAGQRVSEPHSGSDSNHRTSPSKKKPHRLTGVQRGLLLLLGSLVILAGVVFGVYKAVVRPPDVTGPTKDSGGKDSGKSNTVKVSTVDEETGEEIEIEYEVPGSHKEGYYNILIVGTDDDGTRTDTIMIARMDTSDHSVALMSIPRDTLINGNYSVPKINSVYGASGKGEKGIAALKKQLAAILGFEVDGYVLVDLEAFIETVDLVGGVTFNVPQRMYYNDPTQNLYIDLQAGEQLLDGQHAMQLVRYRGYGEADIKRTRVQQDFLKALAKKCLTFGNITKIKPMIEIFIEYVDTDLTLGNMVYFAQELLKCDFDSMETFTLPGQGGVMINGGDHYALFPSQVLEIVNENFNPYDTDIPLSNLHIRTSGGSGSSSGSSGSSGTSSGSSGSSGSATPEPTEPTDIPEEPSEPEDPTEPTVPTEPTDPEDPNTAEQPNSGDPPATEEPDPVIPLDPDNGDSNGADILDPGAGTATDTTTEPTTPPVTEANLPTSESNPLQPPEQSAA